MLLSYFNDMAILLSFDTSTKKTGCSVFTDGKYTKSFVIDKSDMKDTKGRMEEMVADAKKVIEFYHPDIVVWETTVVLRNAEAQRNLTMILGAIWGECISNNIFYCSLRPTEWRKAVSTGEKIPRKREELKQWGKDKVKELFGIEVENDDESDSILIGQAYINLYSLEYLDV